jgi:hypothetical protein
MEKRVNHVHCNRTCGTMMRGYREALIYSSMSRVASQIGKIATRTAQVVAGTTKPSRTDMRALDLTATASLVTSKTCSAGRGLAGELPRCAAGHGE